MRILSAALFLLLMMPMSRAENAPALDLDKLSDTSRPSTRIFGAVLYADEVNPFTGEARGNVYIDGTELNATNAKFPTLVYAEEVKMDLAKGEVTLKGWPVLAWNSGMVIRASKPETTMRLHPGGYEAKGPVKISLDLKSLKALKKGK